VKVKVKQAGPRRKYSVTGMTADEARFLRDLMGRFADNPGDGGIKRHFHTGLYSALAAELGLGLDAEHTFEITGNAGYFGLVLHCTRRKAAED
jgi:hypothetical protein